MRTLYAACLITTAAVFCAPAFAQTATTPPLHVPLQKTIGQGVPKLVPSLIVMNARGATLQGGKLVLTGVTPNSILFADRPVRAAGHALTANLLEEWAPTNENADSFTKDPPNATVSAFSKDGAAIRDAVVVLKTPKLEGDRLTFDVDVLEGDLTGADGPASIFIDRFGFGGFHAGGFHAGGFRAGGVGGFRAGGFHAAGVGGFHAGYVGVRPGLRGAWYGAAGLGAAAVVGGAAIGATAAAAAAPYYYGAGYPPACGYYPYPPCY